MFLKPNAIVYVRRSGLIMAGKRIKPARLSFPGDALQNLDVLDPDVLGTTCQEFFASHDLKGHRVLVVLDHGLVFTKTIALDKSGKPALLVKDFIAAMPFEPGLRSCLSLKSADNLQLFATNYGVFKIITEALDAAGASKVIAVTPVAAYGIQESEQLSGTVVDQLLQDTSVKSKADFQAVTPA